jgi:Mg/Co/Ni transporter MgtE
MTIIVLSAASSACRCRSCSRAGLDPATASAPLITSLADISGVLIYFSIATW